MFNSDGSTNTKYNSNKKTGVIAQIFEENWDKFYIENKIMVNTYRTNAPFEIQKVLLDLIKDIIPYKIKKQIYNNHKNGFYVYAEPKKFPSIKDGVEVEYVSRYCGRPCISENRIISYDGNKVTFWYNAHEDEAYHEVTVTAQEFIKLILRHIMPREFKTIRSRGFYRKKLPFHDKNNMLIKKEIRKFKKELLKHELSIIKSINHSPYDCPKCSTKMNFLCFIT